MTDTEGHVVLRSREPGSEGEECLGGKEVGMFEGGKGHRCSHPVFRNMCQAVTLTCMQAGARNF